MSRLQFVASMSAILSRQTEFLPVGNWSGLLIEVAGTTKSGQTLTLASCGRITYNRNNQQRILADASFLWSRTSIKGGYNSPPSGSAQSAEYVTYVVPFSASGYPNTNQIRGDREAYVELDFSGTSTLWEDGATATVWAIAADDIVESYQLEIKNQNIIAQGAGRITQQLAVSNLVAAYISDPDSDVDLVQMITDGRTITDNVPVRTLRTITNLENRVESAQTTWAEIDIARTGVVPSTLNKSSQMSPTFNGAGTLQVVLESVVWHSNAVIQANQNAINARLAMN